MGIAGSKDDIDPVRGLGTCGGGEYFRGGVCSTLPPCGARGNKNSCVFEAFA